MTFFLHHLLRRLRELLAPRRQPARQPVRVRASLAAAVVAGAALALGAAAPAAAQPAAPVAFDQIEAEIGAGGGAGSVLLVWSEDRGAGPRIFAKRVRTNGLPLGGDSGGEHELTGATGDAGAKGEQRWPVLVEGASNGRQRGHDLVVWSEKAPGGADFDIYAQRLAGNGRAYGRPRMIVGGPGNQVQPDVVAIPSGYLVVYSEDTTDAGDLLAQRITTALTPRGAPFAIAEGPGVASDPELGFAYTNGGIHSALLVLFTYVPDGATTSDIYGVRASAVGTPIGGAANIFPVVAEPDVDEHTPHLAAGPLDAGARARDKIGDSFVSLLLFTREDPADVNGADVVGLRYRSVAFTTGELIDVATGPGNQAWPASAVLDRRGWMVVWQDDRGGSFDIRGQRVRFNGIPYPGDRALAAD